MSSARTNAEGQLNNGMEIFPFQEQPEDLEVSSGTGFHGGSDQFLSRGIAKTLHWSVPWSDLMMTMFVLFAAPR